MLIVLELDSYGPSLVCNLSYQHLSDVVNMLDNRHPGLLPRVYALHGGGYTATYVTEHGCVYVYQIVKLQEFVHVDL